MNYKTLYQYIESFEKDNELITIPFFVNSELQITEITDRISKSKNQNKALLFINNGTKFPLLINSMGSENRILNILGLSSFKDFEKIIDKYLTLLNNKEMSLFDKLKLIPQLNEFASIMPKRKKTKAICQEIICEEIDLNIFPILKCWPYDGGKFITFPLVHTISPNSKKTNVGMYRMQVIDKQTTAMHWHIHKTGANHYREYKENGIKKMPVSVSLGGDLIYTYCATAPLPENVDEYMLAGVLKNKGVELVKCITNDIYVPADSDIVIEGYIDTLEEMFYEGPFGDHTGYYSLEDYYPKFHITCITHKKNAIYPTTIVGIPPQEDAWIAKATERIFLHPLKLAVLPEVVDINLPQAGVAHNLVLVSIKKRFPGHVEKIANSLWGTGQMMFSKVLIIFNDEIDLNNTMLVIETIFNNIDINNLYFGKGPLDVLDHCSKKFAYGSKICIDATEKNTNNIKQKIVFDKSDLAGINEITAINIDFIEKNIPLIIINIDKKRIRKINTISDEINEKLKITNIKYFVFVDDGINSSDFYYVLWACLGNIEPIRDIIIKSEENNSARIFINGTRKTKLIDNFERNWPNVLVADKKTIKEVDEIWENLNLGEYISSPSLRFEKLNSNIGATMKTEK